MISNTSQEDGEIVIDGNYIHYENIELIIPQYSEGGIWTLTDISFQDSANNNTFYTSDIYSNYLQDNQIIDLGFNVDFEVISPLKIYTA